MEPKFESITSPQLRTRKVERGIANKTEIVKERIFHVNGHTSKLSNERDPILHNLGHHDYLVSPARLHMRLHCVTTLLRADIPHLWDLHQGLARSTMNETVGTLSTSSILPLMFGSPI